MGCLPSSSVMGLMATSSKRLCDPGSCTQSPSPCSRPLMTHTSARDSNTGVAQSLWGLWVLVHARFFFWALQASMADISLILNVILLVLLSCWDFSFALGHRVTFFGGIQHSPVHGCSAASCNFGVLAGEDECTSFYSTILHMLSLHSFPRSHYYRG